MPVLGHAFVGLTTAVYTRPVVRRRAGVALWTPLMVGLAYLPDIVAQAGELAGMGSWRTPTHSLLFAFIASVALAGPVAGMAGLSVRGAFGLVLLSVLGHDAMDVLQGTDGRILWPFSARSIDLPDRTMTNGLVQEVIWFGGACAILILLRWLVLWWRSRSVSAAERERRNKIHASRRVTRLRMVGYGLTAAILALAAGTHHLRDVRKRELASAWSLIRNQRPAEALPLLAQAERWPYVGSSASIQFARAEAYRALGDRDQAERAYLAALAERPQSFWLLADLALFYASSREPVEVRRERVEPLVMTLQEEFANWQALPRVLAKIEARLGEPVARPTSARVSSRTGPR